MTIIESEQTREIHLTRVERGSFVLRFASYRKSESARLNLRNQDYLTSDLNRDRAIFALCDGVDTPGGNLSSQILGEILLNWLQQLTLKDLSGFQKVPNKLEWLSNLVSSLRQELDAQVRTATMLLEEKQLNQSRAKSSRQAGKADQEEVGAQSSFAAGIVWNKTENLPNGLIMLFWLGNARVRIFDQETDVTALTGWGRDPGHLKHVWSTHAGVIGEIHAYVTDFTKISSIIAYSHGLEEVEKQITPGVNAEKFEVLVMQAQANKDDDISFLELTTSPDVMERDVDDMSSTVRAQLSTKATKVPEPGVISPEKTNLEKENLRLERALKKTRRNLTWLMLVFMLVCLVLGMLGGAILGVLASTSQSESAAMSFVRKGILLLVSPTATATLTPTFTPTFTYTPTPTNTATFTPTLTPTDTPTFTPTYTSTETFTPTPSSTPTPTQTDTPVPTESQTPTPIATSGQ